MSKNTLLNYFTRTPVPCKKEKTDEAEIKPETPKTPKSKKETIISKTPRQNGNITKTPTQKTPIRALSITAKTPKRSRKSLEQFSSPSNGEANNKEDVGSAEKNSKREKLSDVESPESPPHKKRKRILMELESEEEDSGDEYVPNEKELDVSEDEVGSEEDEEEEPSDVSEESCSPSPKKSLRKKAGNSKAAPKSLNVSLAPEKTKSSLPVASKENTNSETWPHLKLQFLQPDKIKDVKRRPPTDPNYDPKTLYVPDDFKNSLTPAVRQWWEMKAQNFDIVLFFKVGKFYELYHMDAVIAANELNLTFMRGEFAHVGFPEIAYGRFSSTLVEKGYKVARVEQTETPDMMNERCKTMSKCTKFDKVVKREICQITTRGTRVFGVLDGETKDAESNFLLALAEKEIDTASSVYGICFIDTSIGVFHIGQFTDDRHSSRLRTLVAHYPPVQILFERKQISSKTQQILSTVLSAALKDQLVPDTEFWTASTTLIKLAENYYKNRKFPNELANYIGQDAVVNLTVDEDKELGIRSLGAVIWYLQRCLIDYQLLTMEQFSVYKPLDAAEMKVLNDANLQVDEFGKHMVLDAITLKNLNVMENSTGGLDGTLLRKLDKCCTAFGKRLLQRWLCSPLRNINSIRMRQESVTFLKNCSVIQDVRSLMAQLPDLERLLSKIHSQGSRGIRENHPDTRAFMFEETKYSKRKIQDFIATLNGFKKSQKIIEYFNEVDNEKMPALLRHCCLLSEIGSKNSFPNLTEHLNFFENAFDHDEALKEGRILPSEGTDVDYDETMENLKEIDKESKSYLKQQCAYFGCKVNYFGSDRKRFQLEVPDSAAKKANSKYELQGQRKGFKRYWTSETKKILEKITAVEEQKKNVLRCIRERIFSKFSEKFEEWNRAIQCLSVLDVLIAFAEYSNEESQTCVPEFVSISPSQQPFVELIDGTYPCSTADDAFIPNSTIVGSIDGENIPALVVVTGPNMGGKSTLMRQLGLITIMAHMGCHVPAEKLRLSVVDRVFTRIGANDDIMAGESTFYVELCETSSILQHATKHSLVLIDELGRGTSTYDGTAIASAVLRELSCIKCRTLFSTHYHAVVEDFKGSKNVTFGHMACMVENEEENGGEETVTFLYKFVEGTCPKSYGFNAARLAGMPNHIIKIGQQRAKEFELEFQKRNLFKKIFKADIETARQLIAAL